MTRAALVILMIGFMTLPLFAQGRGRNKTGIPPGHLPPDGLCRVWYDGVPPGHQPPPTSCREAERVASRDRAARVIYGDRANRNPPVYRDGARYPDDVWRGEDRRQRETEGRRPNRSGSGTGRAIPRDGYPSGDPYPDGRNRERDGYESDAFRRGYDDGIVKGREDDEDGDSFDPARHSWYRSGDRGYTSRLGSRETYRSEYRRGFLAGYESAHHGGRRGGSSWWPFK